MKKFLAFFMLLFLFAATAYSQSSPTIFLQITKNLQEKAEIVLLTDIKKDTYSNKFLITLARDLEYSDYFKVEEYTFVNTLSDAKNKYATQIILLGEKTTNGLQITLEDPLDEKILFKKEYPLEQNPTLLAHRINDDIVFHLTGRPGIALSSILFVSDASGKYQLYSIDYDGENLTRLTNTNYIVHYPKWLIPKKEIIYVSYEGGWAKLAKRDLTSKVSKTILDEPGLNACASPNLKTREMAVVLSKTGRPEIYVTDFNGKILRQLTFTKATNASPSFSPCGTMIAFVSNRHGSPQIYTMTKDGTRVKRISFTAGYSTSPAWSPDGGYIAYVIMRGGNFGLVLYELASGESKIIDASLGSEDISWAPDSRHIVYSDIRYKPSSVMIIDTITGTKRRLSPGRSNSFSPNWSAY